MIQNIKYMALISKSHFPQADLNQKCLKMYFEILH